MQAVRYPQLLSILLLILAHWLHEADSRAQGCAAIRWRHRCKLGDAKIPYNRNSFKRNDAEDDQIVQDIMEIMPWMDTTGTNMVEVNNLKNSGDKKESGEYGVNDPHLNDIVEQFDRGNETSGDDDGENKDDGENTDYGDDQYGGNDTWEETYTRIFKMISNKMAAMLWTV